MHDEMVDAGNSHNEDPFSRLETWIISIDESGDAKGKREIIFSNPTDYDLYLNKTIDLEFDKPAYDVKFEGIQLPPKKNDYKKYVTPVLSDKVGRRSEITKTIEFAYKNFVTDLSKNKIVYQILTKEIVDLPISIDLTYQLPHRRFFGRFAYIVEYDKNSNLRFNRKEQKLTCSVGPLSHNDIKFLYKPRSFIPVLGLAIIILIAFFAIKSLVDTGQTLEYLIASIILSIICSIVASILA